MIRILIADDVTIIRKGVRQILTQAYPNAEIEELEEGEEWADKLKDSPWDVIISNRPGPGPHLPVLVLSLYKQSFHGFESGSYLGKDTAPEELIWAVRELLAGKKY